MIIFFLCLSVLVNIILGSMARNLHKQTRDWEHLHNDELDSIYTKFDQTLEKLHNADINGAFESDDEVGAVFTEIKEVIHDLNRSI